MPKKTTKFGKGSRKRNWENLNKPRKSREIAF